MLRRVRYVCWSEMSVTLDIRLKRANKVYHEGVSKVPLAPVSEHTASVASPPNADLSASGFVFAFAAIETCIFA